MNEQNLYKEFKDFLNGFFIRRAKGALADDDFDDKQSDSIRPHLETILPTLSLPEVMRIQIYFNEALCFHLKEGLGQQTQSSTQKSSALSSIISSSSSEVHPSKRPKPTEVDPQKETSQEDTPREAFTFPHRGTIGMMQSTPLSVPPITETQAHVEHPEYVSEVEDPMINDIIANINLSPIPQVENQRILLNLDMNIQSDPSSIEILNIENLEHPFLRNFAHLMHTAHRKKVHSLKDKETSHRQINTVESKLLTAKPKRKKILFSTLCCYAPKQISDTSKECFLHFPLLPGKMRNLMKRATSSARMGKEQSSIPTEKIMNLSNVMRSYASERHSSVELPVQGSFLPSPCTPQNLLRTSPLQSFTPIRRDGSSHLLGSETEQINFQSRSVIRQQPLMTIPEGDTLIPKLTGTLVEDVTVQSSLPNISQFAENVLTNQFEMDEEILNLGTTSANAGDMILEAQPCVQNGSPNALPHFIEHHQLNVQNENVARDQIPPPTDNQINDGQSNWFDILRPRFDVVYPKVGGDKRKRKNRKRRVEGDTPPRPSLEIQDSPAIDSFPLPMIPHDTSEAVTQYIAPTNLTHLEHGLRTYINLIKEGIKNTERTWEHFDPFLFSENDDFEMYTHIFKRLLREDRVSMNSLYGEGTSRLDAARGFRFLLELQTMGLIEIFATGTRIESFKYKPPN